eukprot:gnl/MRDRNA2_/MRDRNA2_95306_c0_seq1.p1 gnl/MRDRNA2_/MRDRNA2_95306_c0~~gnl/MRDRNA2_/MRDRNA2_95306_c0_seq1.p1  ORF type:complete len:613 (-),score=142.22 gnl/MRDRNA2_/MRDRNA2_95306_c0_seq1:24-1862(-)
MRSSKISCVALPFYLLALTCEAAPPGEDLEECADNAHLLVERLRRSYTGHLLQNVLQNFCNGETDVFVHVHHFRDVATCRRMSDKLVQAYSKSTKQKSSMEPYFDWCQEVEQLGGSARPAPPRPAPQARRPSPDTHLAPRVVAPQEVPQPAVVATIHPSEPAEDQFEKVLRNFKSKVNPAATMPQEAFAKLPTTMFTRSGAASAEAPNFAARVQSQQHQKTSIDSSQEQTAHKDDTETASAEVPTIVYEEQQTKAVGKGQSTPTMPFATYGKGKDPSVDVQPSERSTKAVESPEPTQNLVESSDRSSEPTQNGLPALPPQPKFEKSERYDVSGPGGAANSKPLETEEEQAPCPSYAVTLSHVGHNSLQRFGEFKPCSINNFGTKLRGKNELPHLEADGTPVEESKTEAKLKHGMDQMAKLMGAGMGSGASPGLPATGAGEMEPEKLKKDKTNTEDAAGASPKETEEVGEEDHEESNSKAASAAPAVEPAATPAKQNSTQEPLPAIAIKAKAVMKATEALKPDNTQNAPRHSFEDALRGFRSALRTAHEETLNPSPAAKAAKPTPMSSPEDHFIAKLQKLNSAMNSADSETESRKKDLTMQKFQVLNAMMNGH